MQHDAQVVGGGRMAQGRVFGQVGQARGCEIEQPIVAVGPDGVGVHLENRPSSKRDGLVERRRLSVGRRTTGRRDQEKKSGSEAAGDGQASAGGAQRCASAAGLAERSFVSGWSRVWHRLQSALARIAGWEQVWNVR